MNDSDEMRNKVDVLSLIKIRGHAMNHKIRAVSFVLLAIWLTTTNAATQTIDFTVPLNVSNLPEKVTWFSVTCQLLTADGGNYSIESTLVNVDTKTGKPLQNPVQVRLTWDSDSIVQPTQWKCGMWFTDPNVGWQTLPSASSDDEIKPAPGTPLVEEVSGELPAPALPLNKPVR